MSNEQRPDETGIGTIEGTSATPSAKAFAGASHGAAKASTSSDGAPRSRAPAASAKAKSTKADAKPKKEKPPSPADGTDWGGLLLLDQGGRPKATFGNLCLILRNHDEYVGTLTYNEMTLTPHLCSAPLGDADLGPIRERMERTWRFAPSPETLQAAILTVAREKSSHPVRAYLESLTWDGIERLDFIGEEILGAERTSLHNSYLRMTLISAVARVFEPGCQVDTVCILRGKQGFRKSSFWRSLAGREWFGDSYVDIHDKDGLLTLHASWFHEFAEIEADLRRKDSSDTKKFITSPVDVMRPPYARAVAPYPRSCIFVGTTNERELFDDWTGSRRFWVLDVTIPIDVAKVTANRDQYWAEAVHRYRKGERWYLDAELEERREELSEQYQAIDPWFEQIANWSAGRDVPFSMTDVLSEGCSVNKSLHTVHFARRAAAILRRLGFDNKTRPRAPDAPEQQPIDGGAQRPAGTERARCPRMWVRTARAPDPAPRST